MLNGDDCGSNGPRQAKIFLECNSNSSETEISEIKEPDTCKYEISLRTPIVCEYNSNALKVYPYLNETLKSEWDHVYTEFKNNLITEKASFVSILFFDSF